MKLKTNSSQRGDASLLDLLVMLIAVAIVAAVFLPMLAKSRAKSSRIGCVNDVKQIGLSFRLWAGDNGDKMPAQVSTNAGGTMELVASGLVFPHFAVMSNELGTPKIIVCPNDAKRTSGTNFATLSDANVSYFVVPEADETIPNLWLSGDRNLATNNVPLKPGLFTMPTNRVVSWTAQMHVNTGNLCFADGRVQQIANAGLHKNLRAYHKATTNATFRLIIP